MCTGISFVVKICCYDVAELGQNVAKLEERCSKLGGDNAELEAAVDRLRTDLSQMEQMKKDLQHKASQLHVTYQQTLQMSLVSVIPLYSYSRGPGFNWPVHCQATTLDKLLTPMCLCHQAVQFVTGQRAVILCGREGNRRSGIALAMQHRL